MKWLDKLKNWAVTDSAEALVNLLVFLSGVVVMVSIIISVIQLLNYL